MISTDLIGCTVEGPLLNAEERDWQMVGHCPVDCVTGSDGQLRIVAALDRAVTVVSDRLLVEVDGALRAMLYQYVKLGQKLGSVDA